MKRYAVLERTNLRPERNELDRALALQFVREGFSLLAFLAPALWLLWHRLWLGLAIYILVSVSGLGLLYLLGLGEPVSTIASLALSLVIGLSAGDIRRWELERRGWREIGAVSGESAEDGELRFFSGWSDTARAAALARA